jgi:hypothetical protein
MKWDLHKKCKYRQLKNTHMKFLIKIFFLTVIDCSILWFWIITVDPDPSVSIGILLLIPFVIIINLLIAGVLFFVKKQYAKFFLINAVISAISINFLYSEGISRHQRNRLESWEFRYNNTMYRIIHWKSEGTFSMSENFRSGSSSEFLNGKFVELNNEYYLSTDSTRYVIRNGVLYGFRSGSKGIVLKRLDQ